MQQILHSLVLLIATLVCQEAPAEEENQPNHPDPAKPVAAQRFPYQPSQTKPTRATPLHSTTVLVQHAAQLKASPCTRNPLCKEARLDTITFPFIEFYESTKTIDGRSHARRSSPFLEYQDSFLAPRSKSKQNTKISRGNGFENDQPAPPTSSVADRTHTNTHTGTSTPTDV